MQDNYNTNRTYRMTKKLLILGGYGSTGRPITSLLLEEMSDVRVVIAGRNLQAAQEYTDKLNKTFDKERGARASSPRFLVAKFGKCLS